MSRKQYHHGNLKQEIIKESLRQLSLVGADNLSFRTISKNLGVVLLLHTIILLVKINYLMI